MIVQEEIHLKGIPVSTGIGIGKIFLLTVEEETVPFFKIQPEGLDKEICRYRIAVGMGSEEVALLQNKLRQERITEGADILESYLEMMRDPFLTEHIEHKIRSTGCNAEHVFQTTMTDYQKRFSENSDSFFLERFCDIQDVARRILKHLKESLRLSVAAAPLGSVVFANDLNASDAAEADVSQVFGFVTRFGGPTSHAAIVAKAKGIPYVADVSFEGIESQIGALSIVDGRTGDVFLNPSPETLSKYSRLKEIICGQLETAENSSMDKSETYDGYSVRLSANIERKEEIILLHQNRGCGVGLYRSEYEVLSENCFPTEEEQFLRYRHIAEMMRGLPLVIRTFDIGGDKQLSLRSKRQKESVVIGSRSIRFLLQEKNILKNQLKAIVRASIYGHISILFPMVSALSELLDAKALLREIQEDFKASGIAFSSNIRIGCMIEVPSAAIIADLLAKECDFLSIGTNDLVQYSLASDRENHLVGGLYTPAHPSVIRLIKLVVHEANYEGIPVAVCGEMAADPKFIPLLLGLGIHELSVAPRHMPSIKEAIRSTSIVEAASIAEKVMSLTSADDIQKLLNEEYARLVPKELAYAY